MTESQTKIENEILLDIGNDINNHVEKLIGLFQTRLGDQTPCIALLEDVRQILIKNMVRLGICKYIGLFAAACTVAEVSILNPNAPKDVIEGLVGEDGSMAHRLKVIRQAEYLAKKVKEFPEGMSNRWEKAVAAAKVEEKAAIKRTRKPKEEKPQEPVTLKIEDRLYGPSEGEADAAFSSRTFDTLRMVIAGVEARQSAFTETFLAAITEIKKIMNGPTAQAKKTKNRKRREAAAR
jgi:hypothetical protein